MTHEVALRCIKTIHTIAWAIFAGAILAMPVAAWSNKFELFTWLAALVGVEVLVVVACGMQCPLTPIAARYTDDRRDNFDIYLPLLLARYNKHIFGTLYFAGLAFGVIRWLEH